MLPSVLLTLALAALGSALPAEKRKLAQVVTSCTVPNTAALTFDDGPNIYQEDVSDALAKAGATGTFFLNGNNFGCIYAPENVEKLKRAHELGHQFASHTWRHAHLNSLTWDQLHHEFWLVEDAMEKILGVVPAFMRPPYGEYNDQVREVASSRGQTIVNWDFDSRDSAGATAAQSNQLYTNLAEAHPSTILALNHDVYETTAHDIVPYAIKVLQDAGYRLVTLAECLDMPAYQSVSAPSTRDETWVC